MSIKRLTKSEAGKMGSDATHRVRYELLKIVASQVSKNDLNWIQSKWKTRQIQTLVDAWNKVDGKTNRGTKGVK